MRALLISDIHANIDALEAVLGVAPKYDLVWNLGDVVGYGAAPNEVIERVRGLGETFVRGNHDRACCGQSSLEDFNPIASRAARWTRQVLTPEHIDWLQHMARGPITPDGPQVSCMHGSYLDEDEYLLSIRDARLPLKQAETRINFFGHTHVQGGFAVHGEDWFQLPRSTQLTMNLICRSWFWFRGHAILSIQVRWANRGITIAAPASPYMTISGWSWNSAACLMISAWRKCVSRAPGFPTS